MKGRHLQRVKRSQILGIEKLPWIELPSGSKILPLQMSAIANCGDAVNVRWYSIRVTRWGLREWTRLHVPDLATLCRQPS